MLELNVPNMTCGGCARHVTQVVQSVDAAAKVDINLAARTVRIETGVDPQRIATAMDAAGYPATVRA